MPKVEIKIKRLDQSLPLPEVKTPNSTAIDLYTRIDTTITAHQVGLIPLNNVVEVPPGYWSLLAARSSTHKFGLIPANGVGIIDEDFSGDENELQFVVYNFTGEDVTIAKGTRIAQLIVFPRFDITVTEVESMTNANRGSFGSTGHH